MQNEIQVNILSHSTLSPANRFKKTNGGMQGKKAENTVNSPQLFKKKNK